MALRPLLALAAAVAAAAHGHCKFFDAVGTELKHAGLTVAHHSVGGKHGHHMEGADGYTVAVQASSTSLTVSCKAAAPTADDTVVVVTRTGSEEEHEHIAVSKRCSEDAGYVATGTGSVAFDGSFERAAVFLFAPSSEAAAESSEVQVAPVAHAHWPARSEAEEVQHRLRHQRKHEKHSGEEERSSRHHAHHGHKTHKGEAAAEAEGRLEHAAWHVAAGDAAEAMRRRRLAAAAGAVAPVNSTGAAVDPLRETAADHANDEKIEMTTSSISAIIALIGIFVMVRLNKKPVAE